MNHVLKLIGKHFLSAIIAISFGLVGLLGIIHYDIGEFRFSSTIGYFSLFVVWPIGVLFLCSKKRIIRWYIGAMVLILLLTSAFNYYMDSFVVSENISSYLKEDSQFNTIASMFLPEEKDLESAEKIEYIHKRWYAGRQYIYLSARYDASMYDTIIDKLSRVHALAKSTHSGAPYYLTEEAPFVMNGHIYRSLRLSYCGEDYALIFCYCNDSSSIQMVFMRDPYLSWISVEDRINELRTGVYE